MSNVVQFKGKKKPEPPAPARGPLYVEVPLVAQAACIARHVRRDEPAAAELFGMAIDAFLAGKAIVTVSAVDRVRLGPYVDLADNPECYENTIAWHELNIEAKLR